MRSSICERFFPEFGAELICALRGIQNEGAGQQKLPGSFRGGEHNGLAGSGTELCSGWLFTDGDWIWSSNCFDGGSALFFRYGGVSGAVFVHLHGAGGFFGAAISSCYPAAVGSVSGTDLYGGKCFVNSFVS